MQTAKVLVNLGGDKGNQVPKVVTASEIAVLRAIHGEEAISDIEPLEDVQRSDREELERLFLTYGAASDGEGRSHVRNLFPGIGARVFQKLDELGLHEQFYKPIARANVAAAPISEVTVAEDATFEIGVEEPKPDPLDHDGDGKKGGAKKAAKKAKAEPEPEPTADEPVVPPPADTESDGVKDMFG